MEELKKLKKKTQKISAVLDFYDDLGRRKIHDKKELKDVKLKIEFAKKQIMKLCMDSKQIINEAEQEDRF